MQKVALVIGAGGATGGAIARRFAPLVNAGYRAIWADRKNLKDPQGAGKVLQVAGFDPAAIPAPASEPAVKDRLKSVTQEAVERGLFGAPTFFVDGKMHWGQDRQDFVKQALETT